MKSSIAAAIGVLFLCASLAACGEEEPVVCTSVDSLQSSVDDLKNVDIASSSAVRDLEEGLTAVQDDLVQVKTDAKTEFESQIEAVEASYAGLETSVATAKTDASAATLAAAGSALSAFGSAVDTLLDDIQATC